MSDKDQNAAADGAKVIPMRGQGARRKAKAAAKAKPAAKATKAAARATDAAAKATNAAGKTTKAAGKAAANGTKASGKTAKRSPSPKPRLAKAPEPERAPEAAPTPEAAPVPELQPLTNGWEALGYLSRLPGWYRSQINIKALDLGPELVGESAEQLGDRLDQAKKALSNGNLRDRVAHWFAGNAQDAARLAVVAELQAEPRAEPGQSADWWLRLVPEQGLAQLENFQQEFRDSLRLGDGSPKSDKVLRAAASLVRSKDPIVRLEQTIAGFLSEKGEAASTLLAVTRDQALRDQVQWLEAASSTSIPAKDEKKEEALTVDGFIERHWDALGKDRAAPVVNYAHALGDHLQHLDESALRTLADSVGTPIAGFDQEAAARVGRTRVQLGESWRALRETRERAERQGKQKIVAQVDRQLGRVERDGRDLWDRSHPDQFLSEQGFTLAVSLAANTALEPEIAQEVPAAAQAPPEREVVPVGGREI